MDKTTIYPKISNDERVAATHSAFMEATGKLRNLLFQAESDLNVLLKKWGTDPNKMMPDVQYYYYYTIKLVDTYQRAIATFEDDDA